ncbi:MAG: 3-deoxy-7-phosphoheptulonate synthase [Armatimonadota bacterium]|jgi:3-deoxy-7-phosphoheptulonate synthase
MVIVMQAGATEAQVEGVIGTIKGFGFQAHPIHGVNLTVIAVVGDKTQEHLEAFQLLEGVDHVARIDKPYKLAARRPEIVGTTVIEVGPAIFGGSRLTVIAGPCAVESEEGLREVARGVAAAGGAMLRGGAYKPRTSPYTFQGMREAGLALLKMASQRTGLPFVTEVMDTRMVDLVARYADMLQIGARNMQNFPLLSEVGQTGKPVLLKRGLSSTIEDLLMAAEYIMSTGNEKIVLCERGIRTFETATRNTLDLSAVPALKRFSHLPVVVDPSHGTGHSWMVPAMAKAAVAAGADGLMVEVHQAPERAVSDGPQSLTIAEFQALMEALQPIAKAVGRSICP